MAPYTQILATSVVLSFLIGTILFGAPVVPALFGALGMGGLLYLRSGLPSRIE